MDGVTLYDAPGFKQLIEERWVAVALLYGPPLPHFAMYHDWTMPLAFHMALEQVFDPEEVKRVGMRRMAFDYFEWYTINENQQR